MEYSVILLAAGSGTRMNLGYNKMLTKINHKPLIILSIKTFIEDSECKQIILVTNHLEKKEIQTILEEHQINQDKYILISGGKERQHSVYNGLQKVNQNIVLVHDGARPFIKKDLIEALVKEANNSGCAIPGVKVKDTIKVVENLTVQETLPRDFLYAVQTPQACQTTYLKEVHEKAKLENYLGTDEASLIEKYTNLSVKIIESSYENIKITTQDDLMYATRLYDKYFK